MSEKNREEALLFLQLMVPKIRLDNIPNNSENYPDAFEQTVAFNTRRLKTVLQAIEKELDRLEASEENSD